METNLHSNDSTRSTSGLAYQQTMSPSWHQRISWPAVFAGLIIAILVQLALTLLGIAIGMGTVDAVNHDTPGTGLAIGSGIYSAVSLIISMFAGGWVAGRLAKDKHTSESMIHGLLVAGLFFLITFYLISNAIGGIIGGAGSMVGKAVSGAVPSVKQAAMNRYNTNTNAGKQQLAADSAKVTEQVAAHKEEIEQKARQVADDAASAAGKAALYSFVGVLLGAGAAAFGAKFGRDSKIPHDYHTHHLASSERTDRNITT